MHRSYVAVFPRTSPVLLAALAILAAPPAEAGAPLPRVSIRVPSSLPQGASLRLEMEANCTARLPKVGPGQVSVWREGKPVPGRWQRDPRFVVFGGPGRRLVFEPARPLPPGRYEIRWTEAGRDKPQRRFTSVRAADIPPQRYRGLRSAFCRRHPGYFEGCFGGQGVYLKPGQEGGRWVAWVRERGKPYDRRASWETTLLTGGMLGGARKVVVTLRMLDPLGRETGRPCEIALDTRGEVCDRFPKGRGIGRGRGAPTGAKRARCAKRVGKGVWRSAIDGVRLTFP